MPKVDFYEGETWDGSYRAVVWQAQIKGEDSIITCRIQSEVLRDQFQAASSEKQVLLKVFRLNRPQIEKISERLINSQRFEPDGTIEIRKADI